MQGVGPVQIQIDSSPSWSNHIVQIYNQHASLLHMHPKQHYLLWYILRRKNSAVVVEQAVEQAVERAVEWAVERAVQRAVQRAVEQVVLNRWLSVHIYLFVMKMCVFSSWRQKKEEKKVFLFLSWREIKVKQNLLFQQLKRQKSFTKICNSSDWNKKSIMKYLCFIW